MGYAHNVARDHFALLGTAGVTRIGAGETLSRLRRGHPIAFVDARREDVWRRAREKLPGAMRLAPDRMDETLPMIPAGRTIVVYCTCKAEASSLAAAELLAARGYEDVHVLYGGLGAWRLVEGPMEPM
jgi:rhodanese-related sulfurtransferase